VQPVHQHCTSLGRDRLRRADETHTAAGELFRFPRPRSDENLFSACGVFQTAPSPARGQDKGGSGPRHFSRQNLGLVEEM